MRRRPQVDFDERDRIVFGHALDWKKALGGTANFRGLDIGRLNELLDGGFIHPDEAQNMSPTTEEFAEFMEQYPEFLAHGYVVSPEREDTRVTLEGIEARNVSPAALKAFKDMFSSADEFECNKRYCRAWWD